MVKISMNTSECMEKKDKRLKLCGLPMFLFFGLKATCQRFYDMIKVAFRTLYGVPLFWTYSIFSPILGKISISFDMFLTILFISGTPHFVASFSLRGKTASYTTNFFFFWQRLTLLKEIYDKSLIPDTWKSYSSLKGEG